jgi:hypothetical protein
MLAGIGLTALAGSTLPLLQGCGGSGSSSGGIATRPDGQDYLNFFLNLEYLEAEYFLLATSGTGLPSTLVGGSAAGPVVGGSQVPFQTTAYKQIATQFAQQELEHVAFIRGQIFAGAVARPQINFTAGFQTIGSVTGLGASFNPFANEQNFLLGALFLEDLMATTYAGSLGENTNALGALLGEEAYHGGIIRSLIFLAGGSLLSSSTDITNYGATIGAGSLPAIATSVAPATSSGTIPGRGIEQALEIVYGSRVSGQGSFFPAKLNGYIS